jgi:hypothetical protein
MSSAHKGRIVSPETRAKISAANKGQVISVETRSKLSEANKGKRLSDETREKMSISQRKRRIQIEEAKMTVNDLVKLGGNLEQPRDSKASDYPAIGPMGAAGESSGAGKLVTQTMQQEGPRHAQDSGENTASDWGKQEGFTVSVNKGEGAGQSSIKCDWSIDFENGKISPPVVNDKY